MSDVSLREYLEQRLAEQDRRHEQRFQEQEKALKLALSNAHWVMGTLLTLALLLMEIFGKK